MKKITTLFAIVAIAMTASCSKDQAVDSTPQAEATGANLVFSVITPSTRAVDGGIEDAAANESAVYSAALMAFDKNYDYIDTYEVSSSSVSSTTLSVVVAPSAYRFFLIANPTTSIWNELDKMVGFTQSQFASLPAIDMVVSEITSSAGFTMVNCGSQNSDGILLESLVSVTKELSTEENNYINIEVDRLAAKFTYTKVSALSLPEGTFGSITGAALTARNRATHPYTMIATDDLTGSSTNGNKNVYRTDHNMTVGQGLDSSTAIIDELEANFYWLKNEDSGSDSALDGSSTLEYVLENTCTPSYSNSNNLTQAIVKAVYNPLMSTDNTALEEGTSWFRITLSDEGIGSLYLAFDEVVSLYKDAYSDITLKNETKASMNAQLDNILGTTGSSWDGAGLSLKDLEDAGDYGGYKAATVDEQYDYVVQFYRKAVNYYSVFIAHDQSTDADGNETGQPVGELGRWGMVRNNSYTMNINGIAKEGLPYIPDPTDPDIIDPDNLDPEDPTPADNVLANIDVTISVLDWVTWTQDTVLGM